MTDLTQLPTATEFVPRDGDETDDVRYLAPTRDGGLEELNTEPADDDVRNNVFICDECGHDEAVESDMAAHLVWEHHADAKRMDLDAQRTNRDAQIQ